MTQPSRFSVELRSEITGSKLAGYASAFNQYADFGSYLETLARTAFDGALGDPATGSISTTPLGCWTGNHRAP
jgi:phage head maturation protease